LQAGDGLKDAVVTFLRVVAGVAGFLSVGTDEFREAACLISCRGENFDSSRLMGQLPVHRPHSIQ
jgi:hypothetical protein